MSRYLGPQWKKSRSLNIPLLGGKEFIKGKKRTSAPGLKGKRRKKPLSFYGLRLREKQKMRFFYGMRDKQLRNLFLKLKKEEKGKEITDRIIIKCESRLDNVVFRSGIAPTRLFARQLVSHGHFSVDGIKTKTASYLLKPNQKITINNPKLLSNKEIKESLKKNSFPDYLDVEKDKLSIVYLRHSNAKDKEIQEFKKKIDTNLIIEWYNKKT